MSVNITHPEQTERRRALWIRSLACQAREEGEKLQLTKAVAVISSPRLLQIVAHPFLPPPPSLSPAAVRRPHGQQLSWLFSTTAWQDLRSQSFQEHSAFS